MIKADLHVHSLFSEHPSEWFLQRLGTRESYTSIDDIYTSAMLHGMRFVTITDHNRIEGSLELKKKYPATAFTGVESTVYFPEDRCKIHVLVYGLTATQFDEIERLREDIYQFRDYLKYHKLAHSVAHATFSVNKKLTEVHLQKLLLMFDYFETVNGARTKRANDDFFRLLRNLTADNMNDLYRRYKIEPYGIESWKKGFTGGSDDHSGLHIGKTFTAVGSAATPEEFLQAVMQKSSFSRGTHTNYQKFAFSIYKIAYDFSKEKSTALPVTILSSLNKMLFENSPLSLKHKLAITRVKMKQPRNNGNNLQTMIAALFEDVEQMKNCPIEEKTAVLYDRLSALCDELMSSSLESFSVSLAGSDLQRLMGAVSAVLPVAFLSIPFLSTIRVLNESRRLQEKLDRSFNITKNNAGRRILWFTDTITDLNGPSETIRKLGWMSFYRDLDLVPVVCLLPHEKRELLPPNILDLTAVWSYTPPFFSLYTLRIPSLLESIKKIIDEDPDEILISTPGPIGLLGMLIARLLNIPCKGIYHTDFTEQASHITGDDTVCRMLEEYVRWFYSLCDEIKVPTNEYISILSERGFPREKMSVFYRGIEPELFMPVPEARQELERTYGILPKAVNLLCVGRVSHEKSVDMIITLYENLVKRHPAINLIFAGDGPEPYYSELRERASRFERIHFLGRLQRSDLPLVYSASDLLLFPSTTDTFGMAVLEAQACGLPALVSDIGGPKEIILDGVTGYVLPANDIGAWTRKIASLLPTINSYPEKFMEMRIAAREHVLASYNWQQVLDDIFGLKTTTDSTGSDKDSTGIPRRKAANFLLDQAATV